MKLFSYIIILAVFIIVPITTFAQTEKQAFHMAFDNYKYKDVVVDEVLSVNTFRLKDGEKIRLIGLRVPKEFVLREKKDKKKRDKYGFVIKEKEPPFTPFNEKAINFVRDLIEGKHLRLEFDVRKTDENYVTLAYAFLIEDNTFINGEILRQGFAYLSLGPLNKKYEKQLKSAYQEAKRELRGVHGQ